MRPLIWTSRPAQVAAAVVFGWLLSIELGTSRAAARGTDRTDRADETEVDMSTTHLADTAFGVALACGVAASRFAPRASFRHQRAAFGAGILALVGAGLLSGWARRHLGRFHRHALTVHADHELVDTGPYAHVRHPLYTATAAAFAGIGAVLGNRISLLLAALPVAALVHRIDVEEPMLVAALGDTYEEYRRRTRRLVPLVY